MLSVLYAECPKYGLYADCRCAECHYVEWRYAQSRGACIKLAQSRWAPYRNTASYLGQRFDNVASFFISQHCSPTNENSAECLTRAKLINISLSVTYTFNE